MALVHPFVAAHQARIATGASAPPNSATSAAPIGQIPWLPILLGAGVVVGYVVTTSGQPKGAPARALHVYDVQGEPMTDLEVADIALRYPAWGKIIVENQPKKEQTHLRSIIAEYAKTSAGKRSAEDYAYAEAHPEPLSRRA